MDTPIRNLQAILPNAVDGSGLPMFQPDPETIHEQYRFKGYVVTLLWALDPAQRSADAAMAIWPERKFDDAGCWEITRRGVMEFSDEHNRPTPKLFEEALKALPVLGYDTTKLELHRLVDTVLAFVDDLVLMPAPSLSVRLILQSDPVWDVTVHAKDAPNQVIREVTI